MTLKMNIPILLIVIPMSFTFSHDEKNLHEELDIIINEIDVMPEEIEGCACYLSRDDVSFDQQKHIFASNNDSTAYMMINNELIKFKMTSTTHEPFTFKSHDLIENYTNKKYDMIIDAKFEDSTSYESWNFYGKITVQDKIGKKITINFVGVCGC